MLNVIVIMSVIFVCVIMVLNIFMIVCFVMFLQFGIMESRKLIGKNIVKIIKSIWLNNIIFVSKNINIVILRLKNKRKNIIFKWFIICGIVRLLLLLFLIFVFMIFFLVFLFLFFGFVDMRVLIWFVLIFFVLLFLNCKSSYGCCI